LAVLGLENCCTFFRDIVIRLILINSCFFGQAGQPWIAWALSVSQRLPKFGFNRLY